ncbi:chemotaxis protein [Chitinimonas sp. BJB300]|uniref:chemotaxis protein n=1 Tax=Chitinimonas sp. BJB300 TaxID=1559339 RepID=UPI000C0FB6F3|nr:chemotaxis protein [Chitinimonas sp. BJB300]PHV13103.1 fused signal transduction protein/response regulator [Chitinimonas sp. BJB300]TSJ84700.1 chemotaxis protein CheV [Chitinimonas sp. BJB300]
MSDLLKKIDARTKLAGTNKLEILLFTLGLDERSNRRENFGINVFKVREVMRTPEITQAPEMPDAVEGMVSLRGNLIPVIDLAKYVGVQTSSKPEIMIVSEYNVHTQGFLVEAVDTILRLDWSQMRVPPEILNNNMRGLVTAVTELESGKLVMMLDVEKVLAETNKVDDSAEFRGIHPQSDVVGKTVFYADDSAVARKQIQRTLEALELNYVECINGKRAWDELQRIAVTAEAAGKPIRDYVHMILTDVEMPEMDGYMLTKTVKSDPRFAGIPILMHSSLSGMSNQKLGQSVGVDGYVAKFEAHKLTEAVVNMLRNSLPPTK